LATSWLLPPTKSDDPSRTHRDRHAVRRPLVDAGDDRPLAHAGGPLAAAIDAGANALGLRWQATPTAVLAIAASVCGSRSTASPR